MGEYKANVLDKLVLVSWLDDAGKIVIFVQNTETNDVQKVTSEPNKDHFRIVEIHPNADPKLFEAVISNGSEKGPVRFRLAPPERSPQIGTTESPGDTNTEAADRAHESTARPEKKLKSPVNKAARLLPGGQPSRLAPGGNRPRSKAGRLTYFRIESLEGYRFSNR